MTTPDRRLGSTAQKARAPVAAAHVSFGVRLGVALGAVAVDANFTVWRAFHNEYWPSVYIADRAGRVRFHHFGEGRYEDEDRVVAQSSGECGAVRTEPDALSGSANGAYGGGGSGWP